MNLKKKIASFLALGSLCFCSNEPGSLLLDLVMQVWQET